MPAVVMENELYAYETQEDRSPVVAKPSSLSLSRVTSAPEPARSDNPQSIEARYLASKSPPTLRNPRSSSESVTSATSWSAAAYSHLETLAERPEKRPRLDQRLDTGFADSFRRGGSLKHPPHAVGTTRASRLIPMVSPRSSDISEHEQESRSPCFNCWGSEEMVSTIVKGLLDLQLEISRVLPTGAARRSHESVLHEVTKQGLKNSLEWTVSELRNTLRAMQSVSATARPGLPSLADVVPTPTLSEMRRPSIPGPSSSIATPIGESRQLPFWVDSGPPDDYPRNPPEHARSQDQFPSSLESSYPPIVTADEMKRTHLHDRSSDRSPHGSSVFSPPSPIQSHHSSRTLPSPPSAHYPPPIFPGPSHFSSATTQAAQTSHLQDLQHQISKKTLALQTLQREHDQLLAAFSRSQIRCNTLDKKSQVSDHEINSLTEEKIRLQQQVETLEAHVEELVKSRDEVHKQSTADGAQWRQIMAMSSQLQIKGAEDARKYKVDRDAWEEGREALERRIRDLEAGRATVSAGIGQRDLDADLEDDALNASSMDVMRQEVVRLRRRCADLESMLQDLSGETEQIDSAISAMTSLRQRIASKKRIDEDR